MLLDIDRKAGLE